MKLDWLIPVAKAAGMAALGAMGMVGAQNTIPVVKQATTATPQVINITPECPKLPPLELVIPRR